MNTPDLDSIESQAFGYKNHHLKCVYVVTTNFEKLRFYIQNAVDCYLKVCTFNEDSGDWNNGFSKITDSA